VTLVRAGAIGPLDEEAFPAVDIVVDTTRRHSRAAPAALAGLAADVSIQLAGDCIEPRSALEAIHEGLLAGLTI
jgi:hypothetical protein